MNKIEWAIAIKRRDNWTCQQCGVIADEIGTRQIHAHHIKSISEGGENILENGITVCHDCHWGIFHINGNGIARKPENIRSPRMSFSEDTSFKINELRKFGYGFTKASIVTMAIDYLFELVLLSRDDCKDIAMNPDILEK